MNAKKIVYSAFVLHDDGTWEQPSFSAQATASEEKIELAVRRQYRGFYVAGLFPDPEVAEKDAEVLLL